VKLLVIGWQGVRWEDISRLMNAGRLPCLASLRKRGRTVTLPPPRRISTPAVVWTSLMTGKRPVKHRVLSGEEVAPREMGLRPISAAARQAKTIWEIVSEAEKIAVAVNWPASHRARTAASGRVIPDLFFTSPSAEQWPEELSAMRLSPAEVDDATIAPLLPRPTPPGMPAAMRRFIADAASIQAVTTLLMQQACDFLAVRFPPITGATPGALMLLDQMLGRLIDLSGAECMTSLISLAADSSAAVVSAPADSNQSCAATVSPFDLTPTYLAWLGISPGLDMDGRPNQCVLGSPPVVEPRISWETSRNDDSENDTMQFDESIRHLLDLGYRETPDRHAQHAIARFLRKQRFLLAQAQMDAGDAEQAAAVLEDSSTQHGPDRAAILTLLAEACFYAGRLQKCRQIVETLMSEGCDTPLARVALAALDGREKQIDSARAHLGIAEQRAANDPVILNLIARVFLDLRDPSAARRIIQPVSKILESEETLGRIALAESDFAAAAIHFGRAAQHRPDDFSPHYQLGIALLRSGDSRGAVDAFKSAAALDRRRSPAILQRLAEALEQSGDFMAAQECRLRARHLRSIAQGAKSADMARSS
jgi:Flp pilus assembly protein TadD